MALAALFGGTRLETWPALAAAVALYGILVGGLISVIPTLLGALVVTAQLPRHASGVHRDAVHSDLGAIFRSLIVLLDATVVAVLIASSATLSTVVDSLPLILVGNVCVVLLLRRARDSIGAMVVVEER
jgi:hypothetical protein